MSTENPPTAGGPMSKDQVKNPSTAHGGWGAVFTENPPRIPPTVGEQCLQIWSGEDHNIYTQNGREGVYKFGHNKSKRWNSKTKSHVIL